MVELTLERICRTETETYGFLRKGMVPICLTLELPWKKNQRYISRIPAGQYVVEPDTTKKRSVFRLSNVPNRSGILIHIGNHWTEISGCILVGTKFGVTSKGRGVLESSRAFRTLTEIVAGSEFLLTIVD